MANDEEYDQLEESSSFISNIRRNLNVVTINEYTMVVLVAISILLLSGIVYVLANSPKIFLSNNYGTFVIYFFPPPSGSSLKFNQAGLGDQYVIEMFIVSGVIGAGVIGLYLMKNATAYIDDQRRALEILIFGTILFTIAASLLFFIYIYKMTGQIPYFAGLG